MKLFTTPALKYNCNAFVSKPLTNQNYGYEWWFCTNYVLRLFDLPMKKKKGHWEDEKYPSVKEIWFEFHDRPADDRVSYEPLLGEDDNGDVVARIDDKEITVSGHTGRLIAKKTKGKKCYVECHFTKDPS